MRRLNEWFGPDALRPLYRTYVVALLVSVFAVPFVVTAVIPETPWYVPAAIGAAFLVVAAFCWWWVGAYAATVGYRLSETEIDYRGGVWWHKRSTVPYARITNVEAKQGPLARYFGVGSVALQTAGAGAQTTAELTVSGITDYEELKDQLLEFVREDRSDGTSSDRRERPDPRVNGQGMEALLEEVRAIREHLDQR